ncbi:Fibronectin-binding protein A N-terminus (FbpA) [Belliella buryatensis]|uniref:Fibronectin-binding protein A N-terminus (FbpA) n=1 Tax=Belliella buryatensis TaxID=1500549 RepID=A0A239CQK3_9BACT|nr:NFACT RNA binding domain-containing protein [Belliella buryatensis]SNS21784.1 Fibronectin-binding protein A N-terminus (FbpA) [Belliella buryatensis]
MHLNYHFLRFLCPQLNVSFRDAEIVTCFSQNKDELVIGCIIDDSEIYIRANLLPSISCLSFPDEFKRGKRNTVSLFPELLGQKFSKIEVIPFERAFVCIMESGDKLLFKLHGTRSNVIYYRKGEDLPTRVFRNEIKDDHQLQLHVLAKNLDLSKANFIALEGNASKFLPTLGKIPREHLKTQGYIEASLDKKWELMQSMMDMLDSPLYSIVKGHTGHSLSLLPEKKPLYQSSNPIAACNELFKYLVVIQAFEKEKQYWVKSFEDQKKKSQAYILKTTEKLNSLEKETAPSQLADVIMANLHQIPKGAEEVELFNFYTQEQAIFKLKRGLSPQKFAENLYRKSKNRKIEIDQLYQNLADKEALLENIQAMLAELSDITHFKDLKSFIKQNQLLSKEKEKQEQVPFKRFEFEGFEILIGKSAKSNDEMLRYFAWKEDLWLHAKDVSGSHVIIKYKSGLNFPKTVLEKAAELAAYYSKNKNESIAPIIYTPVKFVRKVKGAAPGAVMVDKEKVMMVVPRGPQD